MSSSTPLSEYARRFLGSEVSPRPAHACLFHVIPAPYEATVSYGHGAADGPEAILAASDQLELMDSTGCGPGQGPVCPGTMGIFTHPPVDCAPASGQDASGGNMAEAVMERIAATVLRALNARPAPSGRPSMPGVIPVLLGGEHTVTYGALKALKDSSAEPFGVLQFDAHADLRDEYEGTRWSHACVMRRAVADLGLPLVQIGNRLLCAEERLARAAHGITAWDAPLLARSPMPEALLPPDFPHRVYLTFDVDGLDPSVLAETGTPVPGGLGWYQALDLAALALRGRQVIGLDVVELAPRPDRIASDFAAASLTYALMGLAVRSAGVLSQEEHD